MDETIEARLARLGVDAAGRRRAGGELPALRPPRRPPLHFRPAAARRAGTRLRGRLGETSRSRRARKAARLCAINILAQAKAALDGDLERIRADPADHRLRRLRSAFHRAAPRRERRLGFPASKRSASAAGTRAPPSAWRRCRSTRRSRSTPSSRSPETLCMKRDAAALADGAADRASRLPRPRARPAGELARRLRGRGRGPLCHRMRPASCRPTACRSSSTTTISRGSDRRGGLRARPHRGRARATCASSARRNGFRRSTSFWRWSAAACRSSSS